MCSVSLWHLWVYYSRYSLCTAAFYPSAEGNVCSSERHSEGAYLRCLSRPFLETWLSSTSKLYPAPLVSVGTDQTDIIFSRFFLPKLLITTWEYLWWDKQIGFHSFALVVYSCENILMDHIRTHLASDCFQWCLWKTLSWLGCHWNDFLVHVAF